MLLLLTIMTLTELNTKKPKTKKNPWWRHRPATPHHRTRRKWKTDVRKLMEQREPSETCLRMAESRQKKSEAPLGSAACYRRDARTDGAASGKWSLASTFPSRDRRRVKLNWSLASTFTKAAIERAESKAWAQKAPPNSGTFLYPKVQMQKCKNAKMQKNLPFWQKIYARTEEDD